MGNEASKKDPITRLFESGMYDPQSVVHAIPGTGIVTGPGYDKNAPKFIELRPLESADERDQIEVIAQENGLYFPEIQKAIGFVGRVSYSTPEVMRYSDARNPDPVFSEAKRLLFVAATEKLGIKVGDDPADDEYVLATMDIAAIDFTKFSSSELAVARKILQMFMRHEEENGEYQKLEIRVLTEWVKRNDIKFHHFMVAEIINGMEEKGYVSSHPAEMSELLQVSVVRSGMVEYLDAYEEMMKRTGKTEEFQHFIATNEVAQKIKRASKSAKLAFPGGIKEIGPDDLFAPKFVDLNYRERPEDRVEFIKQACLLYAPEIQAAMRVMGLDRMTEDELVRIKTSQSKSQAISLIVERIIKKLGINDIEDLDDDPEPVRLSEFSVTEISVMSKVFREAAIKMKDLKNRTTIEKLAIFTTTAWANHPGMKFHEFAVAEAINTMAENAFLQKYPKEMEELLKVAVVRSGMVEFFDAYYVIMKKEGRLEEFAVFIEQNPSVMLRVDIDVSVMMKEQFQGSQFVRMAYIKTAYEKRKRFSDKVAYGFQYLILYKNDYKAAAKVFAEIKKDAEGRKKRAGAGAATAIKTVLQDSEIETFVDSSVRDLQTAIDELFPPFLVGSPMGNSKMDRTHDATRETSPRRIQEETERGHLLLYAIGEAEAVANKQGNSAIYKYLKGVSTNKDFNFQEYYQILLVILDTTYKKSKDQYVILTATLLADDMLPMPVEILGLMIAKASEVFYEKGEYKVIIGRYEQEKAKPYSPLTRGFLYYAMKSYFAIGETEKGLQAISETLGQFEGTQFEEEIWLEYVIPNYIQYRRLFEDGNSSRFPTEKLRARVAADPSNLENHMILMSLLSAGQKSKFPIEDYERVCVCIDAKAPDGKYEDQLAALHTAAIDYYCSHGELEKALAVTQKYADKTNPDWIRKIFNLLTNSSVTNTVRIAEAEALAEQNPEALPKEYTGERLTKARLACGMEVTIDETARSFMADAIEKQRAQFPKELTRQVYVIRRLHELTSYDQELLGDQFYIERIGRLAGEEHFVKNETLRKFGVDRVQCTVCEGAISLTAGVPDPKKANLKRMVPFRFDRNLEMIEPQEWASNSSPEERLLYLTLRAGLLDELANIAMNSNERNLDQIFDENDQGWHNYNQQLQAFPHDIKFSPRAELGEIAGLNVDTFQILEACMDASVNELAKSYSAEYAAIIEIYKEMIRNYRDLDDPAYMYRSRIDPSNPIAETGHANHLIFYNSERAAGNLKGQGMSNAVLRKLGLPKKGKNNFVGYFEIVFNFDGFGEKRLALTLDAQGDPVIFGVSKDHPLYRVIHAAVLESLALKTVPEMKPFSRVFGNERQASTKSAAERLAIMLQSIQYTEDPQAAIARKKRIAVTALTLTKHRQKVRDPSEKFSLLQKVHELFFGLELSRTNLSSWPLYTREDGTCLKADGLIVRSETEGENLVDVEALQCLCDVEGIDTSRKTARVEDLPEDARTFIREKVLVQRGDAAAYNLHVDLVTTLKTDEKNEIREIRGVLYELIPATYRTKTTVEIDKKLYRLKKIPPHEEVTIGGRKYYAVSWERSEKSEERYKKFCTIQLKLEQQKRLYAIVYDKNTGEIKAVTDIGHSAKNADGQYVDKWAKIAQELFDKGEVLPLVESRCRSKLEGQSEDLAVELHEITTQRGFRQGRFTGLGTFLASKDAAQKLMVAEVLKDIKREFGAATAKALEPLVSAENEIEASAAEAAAIEALRGEAAAEPFEDDEGSQQFDTVREVSSVEGIDQVDPEEDDQGPEQLLYKVSGAEGTRFAEKVLMPLDQADPRYTRYSEFYSLKAGEVLLVDAGTKSDPTKPVYKLPASLLTKAES